MDIKFKCSNPDCQKLLVIDESFLGKSLKCPACGVSSRVPANKPMPAEETSTGIPQPQQPQFSDSKNRRRHYFFPLERLLLGWGAGVILFGVMLGGLHIRSQVALPKHFYAMLNEVCSVGNIRGVPVSSPDGTELLYARETPKGLGIFLEDLQTLQRDQIGLVDNAVWTEADYFTLIGWSPDNRYLAFGIETSHGEALVICNGSEGSLVQTYVLDDFPLGFWLSNDSLILMDRLHQLLLIDLKQPTRVHSIDGYTTVGIDDQYTSYSITKMSSHSLVYAESGNVWTLDLTSGQAKKLTQFTNSRIEWLDYNPTNGELLFCYTDLDNDNTTNCRHLYCIKPNSATNNVARLAGAGTLKGQWICGGTGVAYIGTEGNKNYLAIRTENKSLCTNLLVGGNIMSYSVSPQRDKIYAVASLGHEPLGIWEYDIPSKNLRNVLPGEEQPFKVSHFVTPVHMFATRNGEKIPYFMLPPVGLDRHRKYPVVIDAPINDRCEPGPQFLANAGIFYVSVDRYGLASSDNLTTAFEDLLAVRDELVRNPNIDPHRIYLSGACASTGIVSELVDYNPAMWRGIIILGPNSFPEIPTLATAYVSVFVSAGERDAPAYLTTTEKFSSEASSRLVPVRVVYQKNAGHIFNSTTQTKERFGGAAKFILTDY